MKNTQGRLLMVAPYKDEDAFIASMASELDVKVDFLTFKTNLAVSRGVWRRHWITLKFAFQAFQARNKFDYILFGEQFLGLYYAMFCRLFFFSSTRAKSMVLQVIYNKKSGLAGLAYHTVYQWMLSCSAISSLICHASLEKKYYQDQFNEKIGRKIFFVPFGRFAPINVDASPPPEPYFFAGGTSNRDYKTLISAFAGVTQRLVIACHPNDVKGISATGNVTIRHDLFGDAFQECLQQCYAVILPIKSTDVSAGQLVLIDAMRLGKASVVTAGSCMEDYVDASCAVSVPPRDSSALRDAVVQLANDSDACAAMGAAAHSRYVSEFTRKAFATRLSRIFRD